MVMLYKYLKRQHLTALLHEGQFRIGTLADYRNAEAHGLAVGDPAEGIKVLYEDTPVIDYRYPETVPEFMKHFFEVPPGPVGLVFKDIVFQHEIESPDFFIYSMTAECKPEAMRDMGYDTCVQIRDSEGFIGALNRELSRLGLVKSLAVRECVYAEKRTHHTAPTPHHPAILKDVRYAYQREVRAVWQPTIQTIKPVVVVCVEAAQFCEPCEIDS